MSSHACMSLLRNNLQSTGVVDEESSDTDNWKSDFIAEILRPKNISMPHVRAYEFGNSCIVGDNRLFLGPSKK
jgi:hypothetical protein